MKPITAFVPYSGNEFTRHTIEHVRRSGLVNKVYLLAVVSDASLAGCETLEVDAVTSSRAIDLIIKHAGGGGAGTHALLITQNTPIEFVEHGVERMHQVAETTGAGWFIRITSHRQEAEAHAAPGDGLSARQHPR